MMRHSDMIAPVYVLQKSENYQVSVMIGADVWKMTPFTAVLDTGAGPNLIRTDALPDDWQQRDIIVPDASHRRIRNADGRVGGSIATVELFCLVGTLECRTQFIVVDNLAVPVILGVSFIDRYVANIQVGKGLIEFTSGDRAVLHRRKPVREDEDTVIKVARAISLPPMSETNVLVNTRAEGTCLLKPVSLDPMGTHKRYALSNGIADIRSHQPFIVRVVNYGDSRLQLPKGTIIGHASPSTKEIVGLVTSDTLDDRGEFPRTAPITQNDDSWIEDLKLEDLKQELRPSIIEMLRKHSVMWSGQLGELSVTTHRIDLQPGAKPVYQAPYRAGAKAREIEREEVERMLKADVIEPAISEWASPVVLITKKDGSVRFCVDYRKLNALTVKDSYPLPRMDECLDSLGDAVVFSTLDCNSGYWQIPIDLKDRDKTAFVSHCGVHRFKRMPFGLCNAPATFQRALDMLLAKVKWVNALVYLDDVIVYSKSVEEHIEHLDHVLELLRGAGATLKLKKCHFFRPSVDYLGHVIRPGQLAVADKNVETIKKARHPRTRTELRSFLGMCNVYRRFVPGFARIAAPLTDMLKKGEAESFQELTKDQSQAFDALRTALVNPPILSLPKEGLPFTLDVDACDYQLGACLQQEQPDKSLLPLGYYSRTLNPAERNYSTPEKECLAMVWAILLLRPYLAGQRFTVRTDQVALKWLLSLKDPSGRLARWRLRLAEFDFEIQYRPGIKNSLADGCSRLPSDGSDETPCDDAVPCFFANDDSDDESDYNDDDASPCLILDTESVLPKPITMQELADAQKSDEECKRWRELVGNQGSPFILENREGVDVLCRMSKLDSRIQLCIPSSLRSRVLKMEHYIPMAGHPGSRKMYTTLRRNYYWPSFSVDVKDVVQKCMECTSERLNLRKKTKHTTLFPAEGP